MLRNRLEEMTHVEDVSTHPTLLAALSRECPNSVRIVDSPHPIRRYTCLMHALDFTEKPEYVAIASRGFAVVYAGPRFAHWLLDRSLLEELPGAEAREGDLVFYFNGEGRFKHAGVRTGSGRVVSKWGTGHLYEHDTFEVPESYGETVRYFRKPSYEDALEHFVSFAKENGMLLRGLR